MSIKTIEIEAGQYDCKVNLKDYIRLEEINQAQAKEIERLKDVAHSFIDEITEKDKEIETLTNRLRWCLEVAHDAPMDQVEKAVYKELVGELE